MWGQKSEDVSLPYEELSGFLGPGNNLVITITTQCCTSTLHNMVIASVQHVEGPHTPRHAAVAAPRPQEAARPSGFGISKIKSFYLRQLSQNFSLFDNFD